MKGLERIRVAKEPAKIQALHTLAWICHAKRKLKMEELLDAVAWTSNTTAYKLEVNPLIDICRGLAFHDESSDIVQFIHGTVETFLNQTFDASEHLNDTAVVKQLGPHFLSNLDLAKACITYFSLDVFNSPCYDPEGVEERVRKYKFSSYAACNWTDHVRGVAETDRDVRDAIFKVFGLAGKRE
jgi:hypothetical protein